MILCIIREIYNGAHENSKSHIQDIMHAQES